MSAHRPLALALILLTATLAACSAGNSGDDAVASVSGVPTGIERFLLFPNPVVSGSTFETNSSAYASAYYDAVDPYDQRTTLDQFKAVNGFGTGGPGATEHLVVFRDVRDLGYGRRMTGRFVGTAGQIPERVAFFVENYFVNVPGGGYNRINVDAAVARDTNWHIGTNAIEWSCHPDDFIVDPVNCRRFAKYFNYAPNGQRQTAVDLDGRGAKAMPGPCITCHGGRGDPLEADGSFPKVANTLLDRAGDTQARLHMFQVDTFEWSTTPGFMRSDQEAKLKDFNTWVLCTYPTAFGSGNAAGPNGCTRRETGRNEYEGAAAALIENAYGGAALPTASFSDTTVPAGWAGQATLYEQVVRPYCRTCHIVRGTNNQDDIDFSTEAKFAGYADRIKAHVFDRGNMPLALLVYTDFWQSNAPNTLAAYIDSVLGAGTATDASGAALRPGRPIADAGPALRMARAGANATLSGNDSLFASSFTWEVIASPVGGDAVITNPGSQTATFIATVNGDYTVRLTVRNGSLSSTDTTTITVDASFPDPSNVRFAHVLNVLRNNPHGAAQSCDDGGCHGATTPSGSTTGAPIIYSAIDRDGSGGGEDATDIAWLLQQLRGRVNQTDATASALFRKPTGNHHNGGTPVNLTAGPSFTAALTSFSTVYYWVANGMPAGGVLANPGANSAPTLSFSGAPPTASVALDGSASINASTYQWTIVTQPDAVGYPASISTPTSATATLTVRRAGTYVVQLQVTDGATESDSAQRTIVVSEPTVTANANSTSSPQNTNVTFGGAPLTGTITLDGSASQNALSYQWTILSGPAGYSLTNATSSVATLTVPSTAIGGTYVAQLQVTHVHATDTDTRTITVVDNTAGVTAAFSYDGVTAGSRAKTFTGGTPAATIALDSSGSTTPPATTLTRTWSIISSPNLSAVSPGVQSASLSSTSAVSPTLTVRATGSYTIRLTVDNGLSTDQIDRTFTVTPAQGYSFANLRSAFGTLGCTGCHVFTPAYNDPDPAANSGTEPSWENANDSNGKTLYERVRDRVNLGTPASSLLVLNPSNNSTAPNGNGHGGGCQASFGCAADGSTNYDSFLNWIEDGAPPAQ
jgi:PKD repeat protein